MTRPPGSGTLEGVQRFHSSALTAIVATIVFTLVGATSAAAYLTTLGPVECCRSTCHRGQATSPADADRCCTSHLGVLPSALGPTAPDLAHVVATLVTLVPVAIAVVPSTEVARPAPVVMLRGSPPGSLVAAHTALLI